WVRLDKTQNEYNRSAFRCMATTAPFGGQRLGPTLLALISATDLPVETPVYKGAFRALSSQSNKHDIGRALPHAYKHILHFCLCPRKTRGPIWDHHDGGANRPYRLACRHRK